jgi:hypothetical protein
LAVASYRSFVGVNRKYWYVAAAGVGGGRSDSMVSMPPANSTCVEPPRGSLPTHRSSPPSVRSVVLPATMSPGVLLSSSTMPAPDLISVLAAPPSVYVPASTAFSASSRPVAPARTVLAKAMSPPRVVSVVPPSSVTLRSVAPWSVMMCSVESAVTCTSVADRSTGPVPVDVQ